MSTRRTIPALAAVLALALGVAACGGDSNDNGGGSSSSTPSTSAGQSAAIKHD